MAEKKKAGNGRKGRKGKGSGKKPAPPEEGEAPGSTTGQTCPSDKLCGAIAATVSFPEGTCMALTRGKQHENEIKWPEDLKWHAGTKTVVFQIELGMEAPVIAQFLFYLVEFKAAVPLKLKEMKNQEAAVGQKLVLRCETTSEYPALRFKWLKNGKEITKKNRPENIKIPKKQKKYSELHIYRATLADAGEYICRVSSKLGNDSTKASVIITDTNGYPGENVLAEEENDLLPQSYTAELVAHATGSGLPSAVQTKFPIWKDESTHEGDRVAGSPVECQQDTSINRSDKNFFTIIEFGVGKDLEDGLIPVLCHGEGHVPPDQAAPSPI
ncbi:hypothetical protein TURU_109778 [Turdus rufiventris]|nr:hypothetical protein TURU_109778 [Turdus rufiventris]